MGRKETEQWHQTRNLVNLIKHTALYCMLLCTACCSVAVMIQTKRLTLSASAHKSDCTEMGKTWAKQRSIDRANAGAETIGYGDNKGEMASGSSRFFCQLFLVIHLEMLMTRCLQITQSASLPEENGRNAAHWYIWSCPRHFLLMDATSSFCSVLSFIAAWGRE